MDSSERPDGSVVTPIGWGLIVLGAFGVFVAASAETINGALLGLGLANLGIGLGVILLSLGYLVRAIWFLPGREIRTDEHPRLASSGTEVCDWCGRTPAAGKTCSDFSDEALGRISVRIQNPVCQEELHRRGYEISADR